MEAIVEDAEAKSDCYAEIEAAIRPDALLWSSTSNFPMTRLAADMAHPERAIVVHPVQTQLIIFVEVVAGERTSEETVATTMRFCDDVGLRAVRVNKEIPGFLWNRVWFALLREMLTSSTSAPSTRSSSTRWSRPRCAPSSRCSGRCR